MAYDDDALVCGSAYVLSADGTCYACKKTTVMLAIMALPPFRTEGEETMIFDDDGPMLQYLPDLPTAVRDIVAASVGGRFRKNYSKMAGDSYWMNHCSHCDAKQGDHFVLGPDGPFYPYDVAEIGRIRCEMVEGPLRFQGVSTGYSGAMAGWRDWKHGIFGPKPNPRRKRIAKKSVPSS